MPDKWLGIWFLSLIGYVFQARPLLEKTAMHPLGMRSTRCVSSVWFDLWAHAGYGLGDTMHHFFGLDCGSYAEINNNGPFRLYSSLAYSLGVTLHRRRSITSDNCTRNS